MPTSNEVVYGAVAGVTPLTARLQQNSAAATWNDGEATVTLTMNLSRLSAPEAPFGDVELGVLLEDGDGVQLAILDLDVDGAAGNDVHKN